MQLVKCMKCGKKLKEGEEVCSYCNYNNNLRNGFIDEDAVISKPGERKVLDYKRIVKKTIVVMISTAMLGVAAAGAYYLYSADNEIKISLGLMSPSSAPVKKEVKEVLRGAKFGMSREDILALESKYNDSVKELNNEEYITFTAVTYAGIQGRTTYKFVSNNLNEIFVVFYPQEDSEAAYGNLINEFTKEYGEPLQPEKEAVAKTQWNNGKVAIEIEKGEYITLTAAPVTK